MRILRPTVAILLLVGIVAAAVDRGAPTTPPEESSITSAGLDDGVLSEIDLPAVPSVRPVARITASPLGAAPVRVVGALRPVLASAPKTSPPARA